MRINFPHMGTLDIVVKSMLDELGIETEVPSKTSKRTLDLGVKYSPEWACLPFKLNLGNFIEGLEKGADTLLMIGDSGKGACRLGFYAKIQEQILKRLGYKFTMMTFSNKSPREILYSIASIAKNASKLKIVKTVWYGIQKLRALEKIEDLALENRPYEINKGDTTKACNQSVKIIKEAAPKNFKRKYREAKSLFESIPQDRSINPLNILEVGELYVVSEPFVNLNLRERLGEMGVKVKRTFYLSKKFLEQFKLDSHKKHALKTASPYLNYDVGAECNLAIGDTILAKKEGYDGVIHLMPFTCMPEIVAQSILPKVSKDYDIPILTIILDEQTAGGGLQTRLEAFVDTCRGRKRGKKLEDTIYQSLESCRTTCAKSQ